jgi:hypothetical protein
MYSHFLYIRTDALHSAIPMGCVITTQNAYAYPGKFQEITEILKDEALFIQRMQPLLVAQHEAF